MKMFLSVIALALPLVSSLGSGQVDSVDCPSGKSYAGTFDPTTKKPYCVPVSTSSVASTGALFATTDCPNGYYISGTFDATTKKPFCATTEQVQAFNAAKTVTGNSKGSLLGGTFGGNTNSPSSSQTTSGVFVKDTSCSSGYHIAGVVDSQTGKAYCATQSQVAAVQTVASIIGGLTGSGSSSGSSGLIGSLIPDGACSTSYAVQGTFDPTRQGKPMCATREMVDLYQNGASGASGYIDQLLSVLNSAATSANIGGLTADKTCSTGYAISGTYDSSRRGPACATQDQMQRLTSSAFSGITGLLGGFSKDATCASGYSRKGTYDPSRHGPACALASDLNSAVSQVEDQLSQVGGLTQQQQAIADALKQQQQKQTPSLPGGIVIPDEPHHDGASPFGKFAVAFTVVGIVCVAAVLVRRNWDRIKARVPILNRGSANNYANLGEMEDITVINY